MMITEEMMAEDEKHWHARNIIAELGYCGKYIRHRKSITNDNLRFYAYIMRKACTMLKEREAVEPTVNGIEEEYDGHGSWWYQCGKCKMPIDYGDGFCRHCGRAVKWK